MLTHWGRVMHKCVSKLTIIGSDNGLAPTNAGTLLIWPLGTNFSEISIEIHIFSFKKMHLKMSSGKWWPLSRPQCVNYRVHLLHKAVIDNLISTPNEHCIFIVLPKRWKRLLSWFLIHSLYCFVLLNPKVPVPYRFFHHCTWKFLSPAQC